MYSVVSSRGASHLRSFSILLPDQGASSRKAPKTAAATRCYPAAHLGTEMTGADAMAHLRYLGLSVPGLSIHEPNG